MLVEIFDGTSKVDIKTIKTTLILIKDITS